MQILFCQQSTICIKLQISKHKGENMCKIQINYRKRLEKVYEYLKGGSLLILSHPISTRDRTTENKYRQDSFLYYLTNFTEPECALLILGHKKEGERFILFLRDNDPVAELWNYKRLGVKNATSQIPIDQAFPIETLWNKLPDLLMGTDKVYYSFGKDLKNDECFIKSIKEHQKKRGRTICSQLPIFDSDIISGKMRLIKDETEIQIMKKAAHITANMFETIFKSVKPNMNEREVNGLVLYEYFKHGAEMEAFNTIVASGKNACHLHYCENNAMLKDGDLLLLDTGAQYNYYASDVTRTFPIGKAFSKEQKFLYEIVLKAQTEAINAAKPNSTLADIHAKAVEHLCDGLIELGFLKGSKSEIIETQTYKKYYPHNTSHWIGMDTHDVGNYTTEDGKPIYLQEGMVFSVEPGLYISPDDETIPQGFRGIGIRIEDEVLITKTGHEILTSAIKKQIKDLENRF